MPLCEDCEKTNLCADYKNGGIRGCTSGIPDKSPEHTAKRIFYYIQEGSTSLGISVDEYRKLLNEELDKIFGEQCSQ